MISKEAVKQFREQKLNDWRWVKDISRKDAEQYIVDVAPKFKFKTRPFTHQLVSIIVGIENKEFLYLLDMGLGKSKIVIDLIQYHMKYSNVKKSLVLSPSPVSVFDFAEQVNIHSNLSHIEVYGKKEDRWDSFNKEADIYIINYDGLKSMITDRQKGGFVSQAKKISNMFDLVVFDEIHLCKNRTTINFKMACFISSNANIRYGLTGTPHGRDPQDLWAQFYIIDRGKTLGNNISMFREAYFTTKINFWGGYEYKFNEKYVDSLSKRIANRSLRYEENEAQDLPKLTRIKTYVGLGVEARGYYNAAVNGLVEVKGDYKKLDAIFIRLRQICSGFLGHKLDEENVMIDFDDITKIEALTDLILSTPKEAKVVVFHEFIRSGTNIAKALDDINIKYERLYGATKDKDAVKNRFIKDQKCKVFIVNHRSGGTGLNLQTANYVIYYESPVSSIVRKQSEKRVYRTGQTKHTFIYDIVVKNSVEEKILRFIQEGKNLFKAIIDGKENIERLV